MLVVISKVLVKTLHWTEWGYELSELKAFCHSLLPFQILTGYFTFTYPWCLLVCVADVWWSGQTWETVGSNVISRRLQVEDRWDTGGAEGKKIREGPADLWGMQKRRSEFLWVARNSRNFSSPGNPQWYPNETIAYAVAGCCQGSAGCALLPHQPALSSP